MYTDCVLGKGRYGKSRILPTHTVFHTTCNYVTPTPQHTHTHPHLRTHPHPHMHIHTHTHTPLMCTCISHVLTTMTTAAGATNPNTVPFRGDSQHLMMTENKEHNQNILPEGKEKCYFNTRGTCHYSLTHTIYSIHLSCEIQDMKCELHVLVCTSSPPIAH